MNDSRILSFLAVCEESSFTKAAARLSLTQPAVSQHIRSLEEQFGGSLFTYDHRILSLTLRGERLLVARRAAPALEADEWWAADLEGCAVHDGPRDVGTVLRLTALPSCDVLEVDRGDGDRPMLVPLVRDAVRSVDVAARRIDVDLGFLGAG